MLLQSLQWNKWLTQGSQKNTIGSKQTWVCGWQSVRFSVSRRQIQSECEGPPGCHFPPLLSHHKWASSHRDWLRGERPQAASTPQSGVGLPLTLHTGGLNPLQLIQRGFLKISPKPRISASVKQRDCCTTVNTKSSWADHNLLFMSISWWSSTVSLRLP